jgi:hypothetical protein
MAVALLSTGRKVFSISSVAIWQAGGARALN